MKWVRPFACYEGDIYPKHEGIYVAPICSKINQQHDYQLTRYKPKTFIIEEKPGHLVLSWIVTQVNKLDPALGQLHETF